MTTTSAPAPATRHVKEQLEIERWQEPPPASRSSSFQAPLGCRSENIAVQLRGRRGDASLEVQP